MSLVRAPIAWFGKLPGRGDFVKSATAPQLTAMLDQWLAQMLEEFAAEPRWKHIYDAARPLHFAFLGSRSRMAVAGHLVASRDSGERRFPFLAASQLEVDEPLAFIARSPLALARLWARQEALVRACVLAPEPATAIQSLAEADIKVETSAAAHDGSFADFTELQTLGGLQNLLTQCGHRVSIRRVLLALGLLLQPVLTSSAPRLEKGLLLPLPADPLYKSLTAAFWLSLIAPFVARAEFELAVMLTEAEGRPNLLVGFNGASPSTLRSALDAEASLALNVSFAEADWVEQYLDGSYGVRKLATYLEQPEFSLASAIDSFMEAFIG